MTITSRSKVLPFQRITGFTTIYPLTYHDISIFSLISVHFDMGKVLPSDDGFREMFRSSQRLFRGDFDPILSGISWIDLLVRFT